jgi:hypothetical protein
MKTSTKGRARGGGRGVRPGRGAGKAPKRGLLSDAHEQRRRKIIDDHLGSGAALLYKAALPFEIHRIADATPACIRELGVDDPTDDWEIAPYADPRCCWIDIANQALNSGLRLSFDVPRGLSCQLTALWAARLGPDVRAAYDVIRKRLVLWHENEDELQEGGFKLIGERDRKVLV